MGKISSLSEAEYTEGTSTDVTNDKNVSSGPGYNMSFATTLVDSQPKEVGTIISISKIKPLRCKITQGTNSRNLASKIWVFDLC